MTPEIRWKNLPKCMKCAIQFNTPYLWCPECNGLIEIEPISVNLNQNTLLRRISTTSSIWSFHEFLPTFKNQITLCEGFTPLIPIKNISEMKGILLKMEFRNPSGSFRDRASPLILADAIAKGKKNIVNSSTGSYSISLAAYSARAGLNSINIIPRNMELSKIEQMKVYGARVEARGESFEESSRATKDFINSEINYDDCYLPPPSSNILTIEGQKTLGLEIALHHPSIKTIIAPLGSGTLIYSVYRGLEDAKHSGLIDKIPTIHSVSLKRTGLSYIVESLESHDSEILERAKDIVSQTGGKQLIIEPEVMIKDALELAEREGLFIEPASASVISGLWELIQEKIINPKYHDQTLAILTGSGLNAMNLFASKMRSIKKAVWGLSQTTTLKFEILNMIAEDIATSGSGIWTEMGRETRSKQSIYMQLDDLELKGLIQIEDRNKKPRRYSITPKGLEILKKKRDLMMDFL